VNVGQSSTLSFALTNTGNASVTISSVSASGTGFSETGITAPLSLAPSQSATVSVVFAPLVAGSDSGSVSVVSNATNSPLSIPLSGTAGAPQLGASPASVSFGNVVVGSSGQQTITLTNLGSANLNISSSSVSGTGFTITGLSLPLTLSPSQSTSFSTVFTPLAAGAVTGSISLVSNDPASPMNLPLSGTAVAQTLTLSANPTSLSFGNVNVGLTGTLPFVVTNTGNASVIISSVSASGAGFSETGITAPLTLAANQSATVSVVFTPLAAGSDTGSVSVVSNATNSPLTVSLSGTAVAQTLTLSANPTSLAFGNVNVGQTGTLPFVVTNTGNASVIISSVSASGTGFSESGITAPLTLAANQSATVSVVFTPLAAGSDTGSVSVVSNATNSPLTVSLSGTAVGQTLTLSANPTSLAFGNVNVGQTGTLSFGVMNTGNASVVISSVSASGTGFSESGITAPLTLAANQSAMVNVIFAPTAAGSDTGSVSVVSNATNSPLTVSLSGTAVGQTLTLGASPTNLAFGNVTVGQTSTLNFVVTNTGNASVTVSSVSASGAGFSETGITAPLVLSANQSATVSVAFTPSAAGEVSGSVSVTSNATNSPLTVSLSGTGVTQVQHTADLTWTASQGGDIAGYNVYRATESEGPFTKINPALVVATSYTDQTVQPKTTYYFVVTAVDNEGNESPYGNEVIVEVP
jgi:Abnormal spindle-like microcephaly-assoc'd, ASPM-SPD-2-Hydin/Fibronectin type III domain